MGVRSTQLPPALTAAQSRIAEQDKRIVTLEAENAELLNVTYEQKTRIAELEAALMEAVKLGKTCNHYIRRMKSEIGYQHFVKHDESQFQIIFDDLEAVAKGEKQ